MLQHKDEGFTEIRLWRPVDAKDCSYRNKKSQQIFVLSQVEFSSASFVLHPFLVFFKLPACRSNSTARGTTKISQLLDEALCAHHNLFISLFTI